MKKSCRRLAGGAGEIIAAAAARLRHIDRRANVPAVTVSYSVISSLYERGRQAQPPTRLPR